jgi:hypothetical protein
VVRLPQHKNPTWNQRVISYPPPKTLHVVNYPGSRRHLGIAVTGDEGDRRPPLPDWCDRVKRAAETVLKELTRDQRDDDDISHLKARVHEMAAENELLHAKVDRLEGGFPLERRGSRRYLA